MTPSLSISLNGEGEEQCFICAPDIDVISNGSAADTLDSFQVSNFGNPDTQEFYIQNVGDEPLTISQILLRNDSLPFSTPSAEALEPTAWLATIQTERSPRMTA